MELHKGALKCYSEGVGKECQQGDLILLGEDGSVVSFFFFFPLKLSS